MPDYNTVRQALGMPRARNWSDVTSNPEYQRRLAIAYNSVDDLDLYVGGLSEDKVGTGIIGPTFNALVTAQFLRTRDADPYFFMRPGLFSTDELNKIQNRSLSSMILDFTQVGEERRRVHIAPPDMLPGTGEVDAVGRVRAGTDPDG